MADLRFPIALILSWAAAPLWAEPPKDQTNPSPSGDQVNVYNMGAAASKCRADYGVSCARLGANNPAWNQILQGLSPAERQKMVGAFGVNPSFLTDNSAPVANPNNNAGKPNPGAGTVNPTGSPQTDSAGFTGPPTSGPQTSPGGGSTGGDGSASTTPNGPGGGDSASGAGGGTPDPAAAAGLEKLNKRAISDSQAQAMGQKLKGIGGKADSLFGPQKQPEELGGGKERAGGQGRPGGQAQQRLTGGGAGAGGAAAAPSAAGASAGQAFGNPSAVPKRYSQYGAVPRPGAAKDASAPRPAPLALAPSGGAGAAPGPSAGFSETGWGRGSQSAGTGRASDLKAAARAVGKGKDGKSEAEAGELSAQEQQELDEFLNLIDKAAATGDLDSKGANSKLVDAEARVREGSPLEDPLGAVRTIFEHAQAGRRSLTDREQTVVLAAARQLGFRFSRTQAYRLFYSLERGEPPPAKVSRLSWWQRIVRVVRGWLKSG